MGNTAPRSHVATVKLSDADDEKLTRLGRSRGLTRSALIREAITLLPDDAPPPTVGDLIGDILGCVLDAPADLSSNPAYLDDFGP